MTESVYEKMKRMGVDLSWYEKSGHTPKNGPIALSDEVCSRLSIYYLKRDGNLYTCKTDGEPYMQVRETGKQIKQDTYICVKCKKQFKTYEEGVAHE